MRGDDRAGLHEAAQFEGDRRAHHHRLPFERHRQIARPGQPMIAGPVEKFPARRVDGAQERIVLAEDQVHRTREREGDLVDDVGERRVGGQPQNLRAADVADVIGADDDVRRRASVIVGRPHADGDARQAGERFDAADDLRRPDTRVRIDRSAARNRRRAALAPLRVGQDRLDDRRIAHVARLASRQAPRA